MYNRLVWVVGAFMVGGAGAAMAEPDIYLGASAGQTQVKEDFNVGPDFDESQTGYKVFGGARFGLLGVEAGYVDFGDSDATLAGTDVELGLTAIDLFGTLNFGTGPATFFAKAGMADWDTDVKVGGLSADDSGTDPVYGVGALFQVNDRVGVRAEYEMYDVDGVDELNMWSAGVQVGF